MSCPFCNIDGLRNRIFYENDKWFAFLAAPYNTRGHAIIAERPCGSVCPRVDRRGWGDLPCFGATLGEVATTLMKHYGPKDILFSSLRGDVTHFHVHLVPLWADEEDSWRKGKGDSYKTGHLMEFLGNLEKQADEVAERERRTRQITEDEQRREISETLKLQVEELRKVSGYSDAQQNNPADG
jgi:diadenosine tetraphosphate (Ap4A) HIT family hydrolase